MKFYLTTGITIGIMLVLGSGLMWTINGAITDDGTKVKNQRMYYNVAELSTYLPIGIIIGFMIIILIIIVNSDGQKVNSKDTKSRSPIT